MHRPHPIDEGNLFDLVGSRTMVHGDATAHRLPWWGVSGCGGKIVGQRWEKNLVFYYVGLCRKKGHPSPCLKRVVYSSARGTEDTPTSLHLLVRMVR
jgi:hypothetical protein